MMPSVEERLRKIEDQLEIYQLVCGYGYAVDGLNADAIGKIYAEDGVYSIADAAKFEGLDRVQSIVAMPDHIALVEKGAAHMSSLPYVVIDGDRAIATCHTMVPRHDADGFHIWRLSASRIECARTPEGWRIKHRQNYMLQDDLRGSQLLGRLMEGPAAL